MEYSALSTGSMNEELRSISRIVLLDGSKKLEFDELLRIKAVDACSKQGMDFLQMHPVFRTALTHYRCTACGVQPLYCMDTRSLNKTRCGVCGRLVRLSNSGKHGKVRKMIALSLRSSMNCRTGS
jgi:hypothetical protein